jgi:AraC-like DNA-binding protein
MIDRSHQCRVFASPWPTVYGVETFSARHFRRHSHATYGIGMLEQGGQRSASGRGPVQALAGDLITSNPEEVHDGRPLGDRPRHWRMLHLDIEIMTSMAAPGTAQGTIELVQPVLRDARLRSSLHELLSAMSDWAAGVRSTDADALALEELLVGTCGLLLADHCTLAAKTDVDVDIAAVRERLADDTSRVPALTELAASVGLSKYQLLRRFVRAYGVPPHAWLLQQRAERARRLIRDGQGLAAAALASAFADQSHMTRVFGQHFGFTPGAWQRAAARRLAQ